jgi:hypothetical protein
MPISYPWKSLMQTTFQLKSMEKPQQEVSLHLKLIMQDIVQFVSFQEHQKDLTKEILSEIPMQLVSYFESKKITPKQMRDIVSKQSKDDIFEETILE